MCYLLYKQEIVGVKAAGSFIPLNAARSRKGDWVISPHDEWLITFYYSDYPRMACRSSSGVWMGIMLNLSTRTLRTLAETKAGRLGPSRMSFIPK